MGQSIVSKFFAFAALRLSNPIGVKHHRIPWRVFYFVGFNEVAVIFASNHAKCSTFVFQVESLFFPLWEEKAGPMPCARFLVFFLMRIDVEKESRIERSALKAIHKGLIRAWHNFFSLELSLTKIV